MLNRCWFDEEKCERIEALLQYRREFDEKTQTYGEVDLCMIGQSHGADSFRYLAVGYKPVKDWGEPIRRNLKGIA